MTNSNSSQWSNLLKNLGAWQGSFTRLSPQGEIQEDNATVVTLAGLNDNQTVRQTIQYLASPEVKVGRDLVLEYSTLNRGILLFENGAFSQGSIQFGPFSEFGAEFGFINGDRRLRLVQLFDTDSRLSSFTLIREQRLNTATVERQHLTLEMLLGEWQGEAVTIYPDWRSPDIYPTNLSIKYEGDRLSHKLTTPRFELASTAKINGATLLFDQGNCPMQVLLLPDGASCNTPLEIPKRRPFLLEAGWLVADNLRQRMIRSYDERGGWISLTLVTERRICSNRPPSS